MEHFGPNECIPQEKPEEKKTVKDLVEETEAAIEKGLAGYLFRPPERMIDFRGLS